MKPTIFAKPQGYGTLDGGSDVGIYTRQQPRPRQIGRACVTFIVCLAIILAVTALGILVFNPLVCYLPINPPRPQPKRADFKNQTFAVGFDLSAGYGTAAVVFDNGSFVDIAYVPGSQHYNEVLARMSLESSAHPTPPYYNCQKQASDLPRQWKRYFNKRVGHAASGDVEALGDVLRSLANLTNTYLFRFNASFEMAFVTVPLLPAVYHEDLADASEYAGFQMLTLNFPYYRSGDAAQWPVSEFNTAYAGNGFGLEGRNKSLDPWSDNVFNVLFTDQALTGHVGPMYSADSYYSTSGIVNFTLGLEKRNTPEYWSKVRYNLKTALNSYFSRGHSLGRVVVYGERAHDETFVAVLDEEVHRAQWSNDPEKAPEFSSRNPTYAAARGAALFAQWCPRMPSYVDCFPRLTPQPPGW